MIALATITPKMKFWNREELAIREHTRAIEGAMFPRRGRLDAPATKLQTARCRASIVRRLVYGRANRPERRGSNA